MVSPVPRPILKILLMGGLSAAAGIVGPGRSAHAVEVPVIQAIKSPRPAGSYALEADDPARPIPAVVFEDGGERWLAAILPTAAHRPPSYRLQGPASVAPSQRGGIHFRPEGTNLDVTIDGHLLTTYHPTSGSKPIFFPLIGPTHAPFTRAFPMLDVAGEDRDHPHQRSFWFTHGSVNGIDFWAEDKPGTPDGKRTKGTIREVERRIIVEGPILARLRTLDEWLAPDGRRVCRDHRTATFFHTREARVIDFDIAIEASEGPLTFGDTKEGMFGLRVASSMDVKRKQGGKIINAEGLTDDRAWGQPSAWVDYVGPVQKRTVGIAILNRPDSFRFPTTWHVRDYGLFAANPFGWKDFGRKERGDHTLPAGASLHFSYRIILHEGDTATLGMPAAFEAYARPPHLELRAD